MLATVAPFTIGNIKLDISYLLTVISMWLLFTLLLPTCKYISQGR